MSTFKINTNIGALNAYNALAKANAETYDAQLRLATRKRINNVADDTSGFNVGKSLDTKVKLMTAAQGNIASAKNMLSTGETALLQIKDNITAIRQKISDATDPTKDRTSIAKDIKALAEEVKNFFKTTKFNDTELLVGTIAAQSASGVASGSVLSSIANSFTFQTGADVSDRLTLDFASSLASTGVTSTATGASDLRVESNIANALSSFLNVSTTSDSEAALAIASIGSSSVGSYTINSASVSAIEYVEKKVNEALGKIGNLVQRLDMKDDYLTSAIANATSTVSRLFDADVAMEQLNATKGQIGSQLATSMLAQLNTAPQNVLSLFR